MKAEKSKVELTFFCGRVRARFPYLSVRIVFKTSFRPSKLPFLYHK